MPVYCIYTAVHILQQLILRS